MSLVQSFNSLFAPMDKKYCEVFYLYSVFAFFILVVAIIHFFFLFTDKKNNKYMFFSSLLGIVVVWLQYIMYRLFYNMCK